jgi:hypothetical protein
MKKEGTHKFPRKLVPGLICALIAFMLSGCYFEPFEHSKCRTEPVKELLSPDGKYKAIVAEHFCKPDRQTIIANHVIIRPANADMLESGNTVFIIGGKQQLNLNWSDATHLRIECAGAQDSMIVTRHDTLNELKLTYQFN